MEEEMQELRALVAQLKADNERLRQASLVPPSSATPSTSSVLPTALTSASAPAAERLVFVPRDRKCPMFRGRSGIALSEWLEELQSCMRARHLAPADQAYFLYDHLEGEAREEIKYRPSTERGDPARLITILQELYGCSESYVALQEAFFSRKQHEGETLLEFSLALMSLMERVKQRAPPGMLNTDSLLRDQFVEQVLDSTLRRELKQFVRHQPAATLLDVRGEAIRWEREGLPSTFRGRSNSVPSISGIQYGVQGAHSVVCVPPSSEMVELKEMLGLQQEQLNHLTQTLAHMQRPHAGSHTAHRGPRVCHRCQRPGHFARDCDGVRNSRPQFSSPDSRPSARQAEPSTAPEN
ncbi:uncharacterized protein LOC144409523 [Gasterosteus aculeatus]